MIRATDRPVILLADDDTDIRSFMSEILESEGYRTHAFAGAKAAIAALDTGLEVDCVISDYLMPAGNGRDLLAYVRRRDPARPCFFMMTGQSDVSGDESKDLGAQEFLVKPFAIEELLELLRRYLPRAA